MVDAPMKQLRSKYSLGFIVSLRSRLWPKLLRAVLAHVARVHAPQQLRDPRREALRHHELEPRVALEHSGPDAGTTVVGPTTTWSPWCRGRCCRRTHHPPRRNGCARACRGPGTRPTPGRSARRSTARTSPRETGSGSRRAGRARAPTRSRRTAATGSCRIGARATPPRRSGATAQSSASQRLCARAPASISSGSTSADIDSPAPKGAEVDPATASDTGKRISPATPSASSSLFAVRSVPSATQPFLVLLFPLARELGVHDPHPVAHRRARCFRALHRLVERLAVLGVEVLCGTRRWEAPRDSRTR